MPSYALKRRKQVLAPNVTVVGSPTIVDNVASGFSASDHLTLPNTFKPESNSWEICFKVHTPSSHTEEAIFSKYTSNTYYGLRLAIDATGKIYYLVSATSGANHLFEGTGTNTIPTDTDVLIKFQFTGAKYIGQISNDNGETWITDKEYDSTTKMYDWNSASTIGYFAGKGIPFKGSIDLSQSYIKINGELWWSGTHYVPDDKSYILKRKINKYYKDIVTTKYWKEVETTTRELDYACYKNTFSDTHYNYVKVPFGTDDNKLYYCTKGLAKSSADFEGSDVYISITEEQLKDLVFTSPRYTEGDLYKETTTTTVVEGTPDDYTYTTTETETVEVSANDDWDRVVAEGEPAYLLKTIKYRDVLNVSKVGSPTIVDNVVSGFSASDYVTMPVSIPTYGYELVFGMQTGSDVTTRQAILGSTANDNSFMLCIRGGEFILIDKIAGVSEGNCIALGGTVTANTTYLMKIVNTGTKAATPTELYYSTDNGATFTLACTIAGQDTPWLNPCPFGVPSSRDSTKEAFTGLIDFTNAYLKSGDEVIWTGSKAEKY